MMTNIISTVMKTVCLVLVISSFVHAGFLENFCAQKCNLGLGGNLCRCNGFHFAGKRTMSDKYIENNPDSYKPYTMDRNTAPAEIDVPYYQNNKDHSVNRLREMKLAQTFLRWLMTSGERRQEDPHESFFGYQGDNPIGES